MTPPSWQKERRREEPLDESERGDGKVGLKFNIQKTKIMASGPITSNIWRNNGNRERLYFGGLQNHCIW